ELATPEQLKIERGAAEGGKPQGAQQYGCADHAQHKLANGPATGNPGDKTAHKGCPGQPPGPVKNRPSCHPVLSGIGGHHKAHANHVGEVVSNSVGHGGGDKVGGSCKEHKNQYSC